MLENGSLSASGMTETSAPVCILNWIGMSLTNNVTFQAFPENDSIAPRNTYSLFPSVETASTFFVLHIF